MTQIRTSVVWMTLAILTVPSVVAADISLPKFFSDNMVLQRNSKSKIFGKAEAKQRLTVQFGDIVVNATADEQGDWSVLLPVGQAGGPFELTVTAEAGQPQVKFSNVMVGEVWLCSGQSNMQWPVSKVLNSNTEIEQSINYPNIRLFTVSEKAARQPLARFEKVVPWQVCSPTSVDDFSGTAYFFARELSKKFPDVPIGVINASWGGTSCEAWMRRPDLDRNDLFKNMLEQWDTVSTEDDRNRPSVLFNGMIAPLENFPIRGVIWYQGERNNGRGDQYSKLFPALITGWREFFKNEAMPFYFVQLAPFRYTQLPEDGLPEVWDAQLKTLRSLENTGMVVTTDIGNVDDIHPKNKQEVGRRLALIAIGNVYRDQLPKEEHVVFSGPIFREHRVDGSRVRIHFDHADGLRIRGEEDSLTCFSICGEDGKFVPAEATVVNNTVEVFAEGIEKPVAVRFGWSDTAEPNLVNEAGLPASPFRTDDFELQSKGRDF